MHKGALAPVPNLRLNSRSLEKVLKFVHVHARQPNFSNEPDLAKYTYEGFSVIFRGEAPEKDKHSVTFKGHGVSLCLGWKDNHIVDVRHTTAPGLPAGAMESKSFFESLKNPPQLRSMLVKLAEAAYGKSVLAEA